MNTLYTVFTVVIRRNLFGKAFEQAVRNNECRYLIDYWDSSLIQVGKVFVSVFRLSFYADPDPGE